MYVCVRAEHETSSRLARLPPASNSSGGGPREEEANWHSASIGGCEQTDRQRGLGLHWWLCFLLFARDRRRVCLFSLSLSLFPSLVCSCLLLLPFSLTPLVHRQLSLLASLYTRSLSHRREVWPPPPPPPLASSESPRLAPDLSAPAPAALRSSAANSLRTPSLLPIGGLWSGLWLLEAPLPWLLVWSSSRQLLRLPMVRLPTFLARSPMPRALFHTLGMDTQCCCLQSGTHPRNK